jgi:PKHD-type hydroxylase|tara:strand:+ start:6299 stop:6898 length:600 start_codon:yes stop_codon:yes gene_type:complete
MNRVFELEPKVTDATNYYYFEQGFSNEELSKIEKDTSKLPLHTASTFGSDDGGDTRSSRVKWVPQNTQWWWLYEKLGNMAMEANNIWDFDLYTMPEQIQYTEYLASNDGKYEWHQDIGPGMGSLRKVSITVQLSGPNDYEGGDLELYQGGPFENPQIVKSPRKAGCVFIFPSYMMHRVAPVTKGTRKSFVLWLGGAHYR